MKGIPGLGKPKCGKFATGPVQTGLGAWDAEMTGWRGGALGYCHENDGFGAGGVGG